MISIAAALIAVDLLGLAALAALTSGARPPRRLERLADPAPQPGDRPLERGPSW